MKLKIMNDSVISGNMTDRLSFNPNHSILNASQEQDLPLNYSVEETLEEL